MRLEIKEGEYIRWSSDNRFTNDEYELFIHLGVLMDKYNIKPTDMYCNCEFDTVRQYLCGDLDDRAVIVYNNMPYILESEFYNLNIDTIDPDHQEKKELAARAEADKIISQI